MKNKFFTIGLSVALFAGAFFPIAQTWKQDNVDANAENTGVTFDVEKSYTVSNTFDVMPTTVEAYVNLSKASQNGVVFGNYARSGYPTGDGAYRSGVNFEIVSGKPSIHVADANDVKKEEDFDFTYTFNQVTLPTNQWIRIAYVYDLEAKQAHFYLNGENKQTVSLGDDAVSYTNYRRFLVGGDNNEKNPNYLKGSMQWINVYSDARTGEEINANFSAETPDKDNLLVSYEFTEQGAVSVADRSDNGNKALINTEWVQPTEIEDFAYSFVVVGDTQYVNKLDPENYYSIYDWITGYKGLKKIKYVIGVGDITDTSSQGEWERAVECFNMLEDAKIPHSQARGNHDYQAPFEQYMNYDAYRDSRDGVHDSIADTYKELTVGKVKYLIMTLNYGARDDVLEWAGEVIAAHPNHNVVIATHAYMNYDGGLLDRSHRYSPTTEGCTNNGDDMWEKLISQHKNISLVLCGHIDCPDIVVRQDKGVHGNTVTSMLIDPQGLSDPLGGGGLSAILHFSKDGKNVQVEYFSPVNEMVHGEANKFSVTLDVVDQVNTPSSGNNSSSNTNSGATDNGGGLLAGCMGLIGAQGLIPVAILVCAMAKSKKED